MGHPGFELSQARLLSMLGKNFPGFNRTPVRPRSEVKKGGESWTRLDLSDCGRLAAELLSSTWLRRETVVLPPLSHGSGLTRRLLRVEPDGGQQGSKEKAPSV